MHDTCLKLCKSSCSNPFFSKHLIILPCSKQPTIAPCLFHTIRRFKCEHTHTPAAFVIFRLIFWRRLDRTHFLQLGDVKYWNYEGSLIYKIIGHSVLQTEDKTTNLLIYMFKENPVLNVWQSESNVLTNQIHTVRRECLQVRKADRQLECATGEKWLKGFGSKCADCDVILYRNGRPET